MSEFVRFSCVALKYGLRIFILGSELYGRIKNKKYDTLTISKRYIYKLKGSGKYAI